MPETFYCVQFEDEIFGPFSLETVRDMHLAPDVSVLSSDTNNEWKQAAEYGELLDSLDLSLYEEKEDSLAKQTSEQLHPTFDENSVFYIRRGDSTYGPYTLKSLSAIPLSGALDVSVDGMVSWNKLSEFPGLMLALESVSLKDLNYKDVISEDVDKVSEIDTLLNNLQSIVPSQKQLYRRVFNCEEDEQDFCISEYQRRFMTLMNLAKRICKCCESTLIPKRASNIISSTIADIGEQVNQHFLKNFNSDVATSSIVIGTTKFSFHPPLENVEISRIDFLNILGDKNLFLSYDESEKIEAYDFVNSLIGRLYKGNQVRSIVTEVVDREYMTGLNDTFKLLNKDLYNVISRADDVRNLLNSLQVRAANILRNLLVESGITLREYNCTHENKEANHILVLTNFPKGLNADNLAVLQSLTKIGPRAGIYTIILASTNDIDKMSDRERDDFDLDAFIENSNVFSFKRNEGEFLSAFGNAGNEELFVSNVRFDNVAPADLQQIVNDVNSKCELKEDVIIALQEYLPETKDWWRGESAKQIEIPFGIGNDMHIKSLKITQEAGQNTAVVIGIPGSGKSVFLHTLICNTAVKYSPDELRMYLIDFSGVEFKSYALGNLPHARVIAPEAEREFGLSILNELVEEGARRMALCREYNVGSIVDLKNVAPNVKVPRLLVIIDEFQKLFEVDNDSISKEANSKIHIIIQEFRKFGINLILATQKLPASSFLPRDLIANRIVFKSAPTDFELLISSENHGGMPRLRIGQCIYNSEAGAAYSNETVQGFFISRTEIDSLLAKIGKFGETFSYEQETLKVFCSTDLPAFEQRRLSKHHVSTAMIPYLVPVYLGESIAVNDVDVNIELLKESANNLLVIGGEADVARNITFNAMRSAVSVHTDGSAKVVVINGMRIDNPFQQKLSDFKENTSCEYTAVSGPSDIEDALKSIIEEIERRRNDESVPQQHIYLICFDIQSVLAFDKDTTGAMPKISAAAKAMETIIRIGSSVGVFVVVETDTLDSLNRIGQSSPLSMFNYRVALQMSEDMSYKIIGNALANKLFEFNRPFSKYRGYVRDNSRNITIKFKPYK